MHPKQLVLSFLKSWPKMNLSHQLLILLSTNIFSNLFRFEILFIEHFPSTNLKYTDDVYIFFCVYCRLALYVYEYLLHVGAQKSAQTFLSEVSGNIYKSTCQINVNFWNRLLNSVEMRFVPNSTTQWSKRLNASS